jgi:starch synthase (maltosyl-transferring)
VKRYDLKKTNRMTDIISIINKIRKQHPALQSTWNLQFCEIANQNLLAFLKVSEDTSDKIFVVVNLDPHSRQAGYIQLPKDKLKVQGNMNIKLHDLVTDEHYTWTQEWNYVELDPFKMPFHLFSVEVHESNM